MISPKAMRSNSNETNAYLTDIYYFKVNDINTRKRCEICSKLTIKAPELCH